MEKQTPPLRCSPKGADRPLRPVFAMTNLAPKPAPWIYGHVTCRGVRGFLKYGPWRVAYITYLERDSSHPNRHSDAYLLLQASSYYCS